MTEVHARRHARRNGHDRTDGLTSYNRTKRREGSDIEARARWGTAYALLEDQLLFLREGGGLPLVDYWNPAMVNFGTGGSFVRSGIYDPILKAMGKRLVPVRTMREGTQFWWRIEDWDELFAHGERGDEAERRFLKWWYHRRGPMPTEPPSEREKA